MIPRPLLSPDEDGTNRPLAAAMSLLFGASMLFAAPQVSYAKLFERLPPVARTGTAVTVVPASADAFVDSVGADSRFADPTQPYVTKYSLIAPQLVASNIRHLRDAGYGTKYESRMAYFFSAGITHSLLAPIGSTPASIRTIIASGNGETDFIEGPNEYDVNHSGEANWTQTLKNYQEVLYKTVKADSASKGITVVGPPLADTKYLSLLGNMDSIQDVGSLHESSCDYNPGTYHSEGVADWLAAGRVSTPHKPIWTTEAGYTTDLTRGCSVPQDVAAKYDTRLIAQYWNDGGSRLYFFQLVDNPANVTFGGKGLIDQYGHPRLQFTAISSLLNLLSDRGAPPTLMPLSYTMSGQTSGVETTLLQRRDGSYDMLIWLEVQSWDHNTRTRIVVPSQTVEITFHGTPQFAHLWTYDSTEKLSARKLIITGPTVRIPVTDSISILHFH